MKQTKFWVILFIILFVISLAASAAVLLYHGSGTVVSIYHHGKLIDKISLDTVSAPYTFTVESDNGAYNVIRVEQGRICVSDASCPDHVCVNSGWLSGGAIPIVCLPNELVIQSSSSDAYYVDIDTQ